ncbi:MAG: helitron helicase-like domain-containing protein, partial [Candidatus Dormibacteria bacterium]
LRDIGRRIVLPSSFVGSPRYMNQKYHDVMSIVAKFGKPSFFITFTCNPKWPEITRELSRGEIANERPDLVVRVFHEKIERFNNDLTDKHVLGQIIVYCEVIEFQKRGLPHQHGVYWLSNNDKLRNTDEYDYVVSAEIPEGDPLLLETIGTNMVHGPCGALNPNSPCMKNGKCTKRFPKIFNEQTYVDAKGFVVYKRRNNGMTVSVRRERNQSYSVDNTWIVPYNGALSRKYNAHINVEIVKSTVQSCKYLFKYQHKGTDKALIGIEQNDEIKQYLDCRWISSCEAAWHLFNYHIHRNEPNIIRLGVHLENQQFITFNPNVNTEEMSLYQETTLTRWMEYNR